MNRVKTKYTNQMKGSTLNNYMNIGLNGPDYWEFKPRKYTLQYKENALLCDTKFYDPSAKVPKMEIVDVIDDELLQKNNNRIMLGKNTIN